MKKENISVSSEGKETGKRRHEKVRQSSITDLSFICILTLSKSPLDIRINKSLIHGHKMQHEHVAVSLL